MDATRAEVERELGEVECRLRGLRLQAASRRDSIAKEAQGRVFSADDFAGLLHCLKLDEEEERQCLHTRKVLERILDRTEEPPAVEGGE